MGAFGLSLSGVKGDMGKEGCPSSLLPRKSKRGGFVFDYELIYCGL